jgi:DNA topoisomerase IB
MDGRLDLPARADGHLQATGYDQRGRKQYRYHESYRQARDTNKFGRMLAFADALPKIRRRLRRDLNLPGLPKEKVLAAVVTLLDRTCIRVGNDAR